jgi:hypothetical protein
VRFPNADRAIIEPTKLQEDVLSLRHPRRAIQGRVSCKARRLEDGQMRQSSRRSKVSDGRLLLRPCVSGFEDHPGRVQLSPSGRRQRSLVTMNNHFGRLAQSAAPDIRVRVTSVTISGAGLDWHDMDSLLRPNGLGRYSFIADNEIRFNKPGRQYDAAIMMDCSQCPVHPQLQGVFHDTVRTHSQALVRNGVRRRVPGAGRAQRLQAALHRAGVDLAGERQWGLEDVQHPHAVSWNPTARATGRRGEDPDARLEQVQRPGRRGLPAAES